MVGETLPLKGHAGPEAAGQEERGARLWRSCSALLALLGPARPCALARRHARLVQALLPDSEEERRSEQPRDGAQCPVSECPLTGRGCRSQSSRVLVPGPMPQGQDAQLPQASVLGLRSCGRRMGGPRRPALRCAGNPSSCAHMAPVSGVSAPPAPIDGETASFGQKSSVGRSSWSLDLLVWWFYGELCIPPAPQSCPRSGAPMGKRRREKRVLGSLCGMWEVHRPVPQRGPHGCLEAPAHPAPPLAWHSPQHAALKRKWKGPSVSLSQSQIGLLVRRCWHRPSQGLLL